MQPGFQSTPTVLNLGQDLVMSGLQLRSLLFFLYFRPYFLVGKEKSDLLD